MLKNYIINLDHRGEEINNHLDSLSRNIRH